MTQLPQISTAAVLHYEIEARKLRAKAIAAAFASLFAYIGKQLHRPATVQGYRHVADAAE
ncbi:RSP_7527 family protein [Ferrovibrio sp.]|uniref:RSP_7527 family protein n=1 Tax=Ferrovibrio sp. TaxID=1917215 RepID=UPI0025B9EC73|nr:hypothetical protein [Ferrovibrio sp.]MBX3455656.1 hypothetical protein [Ferrovibrio sp.]